MSRMPSKSGVVDIHGREYWTVARRVADFRKKLKASDGWAILTEIRTSTPDVVVVHASIVDPGGRVVATGHAEEFRASSKINRTSAVENAETSAIGRALAAAGWAGSGEYASADEVELAKQNDPEAMVTKAGIDYQDFVKAVKAAKRGGTPEKMDVQTLTKAIAWYKERQVEATK
mgnify:CR=1 FL=1